MKSQNSHKQKDKHILDNRLNTVVDYLRGHLPTAEIFRLVSAYFTIYGYEALQNELHGIKDVRFLFGDPASVGEVDPSEKTQKSFDLIEGQLSPNHALQQKYLAQQCDKWVRSRRVKIRSVSKSNFLHGKMYLTESENGGAAVVGSSNFTRSGLGCGTSANVEINLATDDAETRAELSTWFDDLWADENLTENVKRDVLRALARIGQDHAPEFIYYKTLYELFREDIEDRQRGESQLEDTHLYDTQIWEALYDFQKDGARSVIGRLRRHNGCILADSVGLGKTYTALAVIKFFELQNEPVLVLCPKKLSENWALYPAHNAHTSNPFPNDRFGYTLLSHTDLSRNSGTVGHIDLSNFDWRHFKLVVIDESHNFRNDSKPRPDDDGNIRHSRYSRLLEEVIKEGTQTKVLMLSATPVNTSLIDLRNQIYLMTEKREDVFRNSLGIGHIGTLLGRAQKEFKAWENNSTTKRDKAELLDKLGPDFFHLLGGVSIARSRRQIKTFYAREIDRIGRFPTQRAPDNVYPQTDIRGELSYRDLANQIGQFALSIYRPSSYVISADAKKRLADEKKQLRFNQEDRERFLIGMMQTNFLKRLESSAHALTETLGRTIGKIDDLLDKIDRYEQMPAIQDEQADILPDEDEDDEEFLINRARTPYHLRELDLPRWKQDLLKDKQTLTAAWEKVRAITPPRDDKLKTIREHIQGKVRNPTKDRDGKINRKMLVFTTFKDTAEYLYENLTELAKEHRLNMAMVSGDATRTSFGDNNFNAILNNFAPHARQRNNGVDGEIDLLIATDCISEGQNLQDCDTVLNYDIHWNPVRIIQRFGRIDRIGSRNRSVRMINYWPTKDMDAYLRLQSRVEARMALADAAASGDDDPLNDYAFEEAQMELNFRDEQLKKLREEVLDFDELSDGVVMSDFTLDYFFAQLLRYLEKNKAELEATPYGAYALTDGGSDSTRPGVIFFLRQRNASEDKREKVASPIHPYYAVYIRDNGDIRYGCANARQVLELFESAAIGKTEPLQKLCDQFDHETQNGKDMARYDQLLNEVMKHINRTNTSTQIQQLGIGGQRDFRLPVKSENSTGDFELVTWLIILNPEMITHP